MKTKNTHEMDKLLYWSIRQETKVRSKLHQFALRRAMDRAYLRFAERHPRWADSLFDHYFLFEIASSLFDRHSEEGELPNPAELAALWASQMSHVGGSLTPKDLDVVISVATDYLHMLAAELRQDSSISQLGKDWNVVRQDEQIPNCC